REGFETAVFLSAAEFNSTGLQLLAGALIGLSLAIVFGVLFARGTLKVPLKPFFSLTTVVLLMVAFQLLVGGLHELSEGKVLPASAFITRSRIPGPEPATPLPVEGGSIGFDAASLADGHMHFYQANLPAGALRFFAIEVGGQVRTCLDACEICGPKGYFLQGG